MILGMARYNLQENKLALDHLPNRSIQMIVNQLMCFSRGHWECKQHQWHIFNNHVKKVIKQQQSDMEKAVIGYGQYQVHAEYAYLVVPEEKWFHTGSCNN